MEAGRRVPRAVLLALGTEGACGPLPVSCQCLSLQFEVHILPPGIEVSGHQSALSKLEMDSWKDSPLTVNSWFLLSEMGF